MSAIHLLVDDLQSLRAAALLKATVWSCSTGLAHVAGTGIEVRAPDALIDQPAFDAFNRALLNARAGIADALLEQETHDADFAHLAATQAAQLYFSLVTFANKGLILARWMQATDGADQIVAGCPDLLPPRGLVFQVGVHDHLFAAIVHEMGENDCLRLIATPPIDRTKFYRNFHRVPLFDKAVNILKRAAGAAAYRLWHKLGTYIALTGGRGTILLLSDNEGVEESFCSLLRRGWRLALVAPPKMEAPAAEPAQRDLSSLSTALAAVWRDTIGDRLPAAIAGACWRLLWRRVATAVAAHPDHLRRTRELAQDWRTRHEREAAPLIALGSGTYAPPMRLLDACLRAMGIPVVCADHGASIGLLARHDYTAADFVSFSDHYCAYSPEAGAVYERSRQRPDQRVHIIGTPKVMCRSRTPGLQRALARRRLGVAANTPLLIYVTSLSANNVQMGYGSTTDAKYADIQRRLVELLARFPGRVVVKPYPAHRFADPEQIWTMPLPENASRSPFGEFRHLRWAADLLLLDLASSTLGWALAPDIPLIYVDSHHSATTDRAGAALRDAVLYVDAREPGWEDRLSSHLSAPLAQTRQRWRAMATHRQALSDRFVLGRQGGFAAGLAATLEADYTPAAVARETLVAPAHIRRDGESVANKSGSVRRTG